MAEARGCGLIPQFDIGQILLEAQHRWLRPAEICEILQNYQKFRISPEPPNKPPSGSLFLFDRKILRYFRKDGLNWRKKNDGKTVKEAHERLKAGSVDVLHCYYAHGEENKNFQRRSYWLLEENFMHIVLVHYLEVKGNRASCIHSEDVGETTQVSHMDSPVSSNSFTSQSHLPSLITDTGSPDSTQTSEYENTESDNYQTRSRYHAFPELQQYEYGQLMDAPPLNHYVSAPYLNNQGGDGRSKATAPESDFCSVAQEDIASVFNETDPGLTFNEFKAHIDLASWSEVLEHCSTGYQSGSYQTSGASLQAATRDTPKRESLTLDEIFYEDLGFKQEDAFVIQRKSSWQSQLSDPEVDSLITSSIDVENDLPTERNINYPFLLKQQSSDLSNIEERLKKHDSFSRWMGKELGELDDPNVNISSGVSFSTVESQSFLEDSRMSIQDQMDEYLMSPLLSQEQLFNVIDFSPSWGYTNLQTKVLITGTFLKNKMYVEKCKWSCMFGEVEVPAEVIADGTLCCYAPPHKFGRVPFYITCSNRVACSEVREFEYQENHNQDMETPDSYKSITNEMNLHVRLENLVCLESPWQPKLASSSISRIPHSIDKNDSLMLEFDDEWFNILKLTNEKGISPDNATDQFPEELLKEKFKMWLVDKVDDNSEALRILDKDGQGVIHLAAALGYDWAIQPTITAGVNINFRDTHGWTALHWAAFCGRERTVVSLIVRGADSGALTDPTLEFPSGRTPADLASGTGHKGIAGFLAESSLTTHLSLLTLKDSSESELAEHDNVVGVDDVAEKCVDHLADGDMQARLSLKDSLSAVQNAAQAAARIYQVFRVHSFHRKKLIEFGNKKCGLSDERALSLVSLKTTRPGQNDMHVHAAAVRIQNKFRGWKGRKEFLIVRQRIVRIQAHVRGHQVRKHYKKIIWSVGIVEKAILRWRRKGIGLRCFQSDGILRGPTIQNQPKDDDYDILQEGRKQTEARLERALARVKSMVQYPEARDQYRRLLTVVTELQKAKVTEERILKESEETMEDDFMVEVEALLENDIILPAAW